ncbi:putative mitochondrial protein, conserved [Linnemannia hyalina]|uniref:Succinate dehydrogenase assembly factor 4, mitochondrial n=1 Tax=Linnemannia hyalina TaxID=64524 RepID=A0A9P7XJH5_9FUNG|nr:putative mitochondrial protein, conserved [Linnemannia hyalina]
MSALIPTVSLRNTLPFIFSLAAATTITTRAYSTGLRPRGPGPIPLESAKDQAEFEQLVKNAASTPATSHPDAQTPVPDEFQGDTNPTTGEVGGPKREPVRFGDWSFKGRVTDF